MVCTPCCRQFSLLLWKNWLLQKRKIILTIVEVLLPVLFAAILLAIRSKTASTFFSEPTTEGRFEVKAAPTNVTVPPMLSRKRLAFTPNTDFTRKIINRTLNMMSIPFAPELGFDTEKELEYNVSSTDYVLAGVVFLDSSFQDSQTFNSTITYKIRMKSEEKVPGTNVLRSKDWRTEFLMPPYKVVGGPRQNTSMGPGGTDPGYLLNGFLVLQRALDASIIKELGGNEKEMKTFLKKYAYPPYLSDVFTFILSTQFPFIVMLSFIVISPTICSEITAEKEKKLKEAMKLMGLKVWLNWLAWFLKYLIFMIISVGLMTLFFHVKLKNGAIINFANASVTFVFLLLYTISIIMSCFVVSTIFNKASSSAAAGALFFFLSYFPFFSLYSTFDTTSTTIRFVLSIIPNLGMSYGCTILSRFELVGISLTWKNLHYGSNSSDSFSMLHVFISFLISILISMFLTWYIENVNPGEFGTPQPFYFPFLKRYWCGFKKGSVDGSMLNIQPDFGDRSEYFEPLTSNSNNNIGIQIRNLTKVFKKGTKPAVNNLSLDICEGKITALLGHNGAGKTTTMSMLTGFMPPTRGTAYINGNDIRYEMPMIRKNLGLCPQFNILFDKLTVREHLEFFAILKGCSSDELEGEVSNMIGMLNLEDKTDVFSKSLSGGMKRKLSVGISLIAGSNFVILDEPSSGMDPEARRQMWDLLKTQQKGRTMLLTTHYMDEADYLGDKIAIMADGVVHCYGSSMFLKRKYGIGYHMTMVKAPKCDVTLVDSLVKSKIPDAVMESNAGAELTYVLPKEYSSKFPELFAELERDGDKIGVDSFGTSVTTLEEVFIKVGEMCDRDASDSNENGKVVRVESSDSSIAVTSSVNPIIDWKLVKESRISGFALKLQQLQAMFVKKIFHTTRNRIVSIIQLLIPVIFAIVACIVVSIIPKVADPPAFLLDLSAYKQTITPYASIVNDSYTPGDASRKNCFMQKMLNVKPTLAYLNNYSTGYFNETSMDNYVVGIGEKNSYDYRTKYQLAVEIGYDYLTGFFNDESYHTIAMALSLIDNFWLSCLLPSQYSIKTINHPLPLSFELKATVNDSKALLSGFVFSYCLMFGIAFLIASFIIFLVNERVSGAKGSQYVSGATSNVFWFANFIWDYFNYLIPSVFVVIVIVAFQLEGFSSGNNAGYIFLSLLLYGWSVLPSIYILSFFFSKASSGFVWAIIINIFTGTVASVTILLLDKFEDLKTIKSILEWMFFVLFPNFCFQRSLQDVDANYQYTKTCATINATIPLDKFCAGAKALNQTNRCCPDACGSTCQIPQDYLSWVYPGIGKPLIFMSIQGLIFFIILLIFESDLLQNIRTKFASQSVAVTESDSAIYPNNASSEEDSDVLEEKAKVLKLEMSDLMSEDNMLVMKQLTKVYSGGFLAVSNLCLTVPRGECFGLLGVNGAGKTSTFKMLTGGETISAGNVYLKGIDVAKQLAKTRPFVGYCPQFDALIDQLTVKETMVMHARLRGIDRTVIDIVTDDLIEKLVLRKYKNKMAGKLSGGNKRKLGIAIALIGDPLLVFLDEPSAGMDPVARRELWNSVEAARDSGSTIILTSHSMEECEALCTRLAIMVNGRFKCLGSCQHLKSKFGSGYTVSFKVQQGPNLDSNITNIIAVKNFVATKYPGSVLEFEGEGLLTYRIEKNANGQQNTLAGVFTSVELFKESFKLEDYSVGQATLEQVFITFAKGQREEGDGKKSKKSLRPFCKKMCCCCRDC